MKSPICEGRFRCQALLDDTAVLAGMIHVDLNPVRAGIATDLAGSSHTSIQRRLLTDEAQRDASIEAVAGPRAAGFLPITSTQYIELVDWSGRQLHPGKLGRIRGDAPPALPKSVDKARLLNQVRGVESRYCRAIGSAQALLDKAQELGQRWLMVRRVERALL